MSITVNPNVTPTFTQVSSICSGATLSALPTTSNNGITGTWSPTISNTATTTYTFTPTVGLCATTASMTISVTLNTTPTFTQIASICSGATLSALPTVSNNGIIGTWSPTINNANTTTYIFTPTTGQCATTTLMTISVTQKPIPIFTQVPTICSGWVLSALPTTSNNGITGTWLPALDNTTTTTYSFTPTMGQCAATSTMTITVTPNSVPSFTQVAPICSGAILSALPTTSNNRIIGTWSPAINNALTTTYTFMPTSNQCATTAIMTIIVNPNIIPTFTQVASICTGSTLSALPTTSNNGVIGTWVPAINNTTTTVYTFIPASGQCATQATMTIVLTPKETPTFTQVASICSGASLSALPTTSNNGITGTWLPAINNTATTTYTFVPTAGQCASTVQMTIVILNGNATYTSNSYSYSSFGSYSINDPVQFTNLSIPGFINIKWNFGDGTFTNEENPLHTFIREGSYEIIQTVTYPFGCVYTNYITLIIDKGYKLIMPTGFTPNENVQNDYFAPEFLGLKAIQFDVYDTWGELIYSEFGDRIKGWDGKIKGQEAENGNYYFNLSAKTFYGTTINLQNPFVLIK
jgi:gliding motility-associated-like protein